MKQEWVIQITGRVQGVGFRFFACRLAEQHGIAGTAQNSPDGSVKIVAQGSKSELDAFLNDLQRPMGRISIEKIEVEKREPTSTFNAFQSLQ